MEKNKVSIIIPSYKRDICFFSRSIESVLKQSYQNIEIIVVDDNAKPELLCYRETLNNYINNLNSKKIIYIQNEKNLGGAESRNEGIKKSTGEYITFLDDDDRYLENKVKNQIEFMIKYNLDVSFSNVVVHNKNEKLIDYRNHRDLKNNDHLSLLKYHLTKQITGTNTFMYKKDSLMKIGCFVNVPVGQEFFLMYNTISDETLNIGYLDSDDSILYREGQDCISNGDNKLLGEKNLYSFKKDNFSKLNIYERQYVKFRHNAVMSVIHIRQKKYLKAMFRVFLSFLCNPIAFIKEFFKFISKKS